MIRGVKRLTAAICSLRIFCVVTVNGKAVRVNCEVETVIQHKHITESVASLLKCPKQQFSPLTRLLELQRALGGVDYAPQRLEQRER